MHIQLRPTNFRSSRCHASLLFPGIDSKIRDRSLTSLPHNYYLCLSSFLFYSLRPPPLCWSSGVTEESMGSWPKGVWFRLKIKVRIYEWQLEERAQRLESESNRMVLP